MPVEVDAVVRLWPTVAHLERKNIDKDDEHENNASHHPPRKRDDFHTPTLAPVWVKATPYAAHRPHRDGL